MYRVGLEAVSYTHLDVYKRQLKNIRDDLIEENDNLMPIRNSEIVYVSAQINGILSTIMIDTGSNISLIDQVELNRLQQGSSIPISTLPINNVTIIGATGQQNKTVRKQVSLELNSKGIIVTMPFLVCLLYTSRCV